MLGGQHFDDMREVVGIGTTIKKAEICSLIQKNVPLADAEGTFARQNKRKTFFSFVLLSLIRTFALDGFPHFFEFDEIIFRPFHSY